MKHYIISYLFLFFLIFSGCTKNTSLTTIKTLHQERIDSRIAISVCRSSTRFIDKYTIPETKHCTTIGNGTRNEEKKSFLSAKHLFVNDHSYYFAKIHANTLYPLSHIQFHPTQDLAYTTPLPTFKNTALNLEQTIITHAKNSQDESLTLTGKILNISGNILTTDLFLSPGMSGSPLFNKKNELIGINIAISNTEKDKSYAITVESLEEK